MPLMERTKLNYMNMQLPDGVEMYQEKYGSRDGAEHEFIVVRGENTIYYVGYGPKSGFVKTRQDAVNHITGWLLLGHIRH